MDFDLNSLSIAVLAVIAIIQTYRLSFLAGRLDAHRETINHLAIALKAHQHMLAELRRQL